MVQAAGGGGGGGAFNFKLPGPKLNYRPRASKKRNSISAPNGRSVRAGVSGIRAVSRNSGNSNSSRNSQRRSGNSFRSNGGGGNGNGGARGASARRGATGVGSNSSGFIAAKPPVAPSLDQFLGTDSTFMQQKAAIEKAKQDYMAQQGQSRTQYETNYLGDKDTLSKNRTQSLSDLENDYASRGMLQSGLYADSMSDMTTDYDKRGSALEQARAAFLAQLAGDLTNFTSEQGLTLTRAQQEAAARRAAQYGV